MVKKTLDKKLLYKEIILLRHDIQRCKGLTLRKMVRKMDLLRKKKGPHKEKNESKADRIFQEINVLKKIKPDDVSKYALTNTEEKCLLVISSSEVSLNNKAMARLSIDKSIIKKKKEFIEKYRNWNDCRKILSPDWKDKNNVKKPDQVKNKSNIEKGETPENPQVLEEDISEEVKSDEHFLDSTIGKETISYSDEEGKDDSGEVDGQDQSLVEKSKDKTKNYNSFEAGKDTNQLLRKNPGTTIPKPLQDSSKEVIAFTKKETEPVKSLKLSKLVKNTTNSGVGVVRQITDLQDLEAMESGSKKPLLISSKLEIERKDSFFLSADGQEVESEEEVQGYESEDWDGEELDRSRSSRVYHMRGKPDTEEWGGNFSSLKSSHNFPSNQGWKGGLKNQHSFTREKGNNDSSVRHPWQKFTGRSDEGAPSQEAKEKLHPSWEAKRQQKAIIHINQPSQNKKIKFD